ncbi:MULTISPECIES: bifunctional 2-polyprenyl-6-hydroxyphenol methylase/3-demethylubiquinol 3-O-methyltransferase UbiG [unclassified Nocardioides]|uniref:class I SAM-dependent methyltransferase n=1 Tax=unclassified Nocardioides TaxID=2615069 RepID=UPI0026655FE1|nr:methyltransferase domain-containing protein [Nocardioides sp. Arc9.136]WKN46888.1 methyltransferase domain-containing protein [Nocardioides sp. Arc9.136]
MTLSDDSFSTVFSHALRGEPCAVVGLGEAPELLPVESWTAEADADDLAILGHCEGPTLDIGCGPGRMAAALAGLGHVVLGIDVVHEAVGQTRDRGVAALRRDVLADPLPGEGRWRSALLADGNVGIGGDPEALLARAADLLGPGGRVVVELAAPGVPSSAAWARLQCDGTLSRPFRWAVLGMDDVDRVAAAAGLEVHETAEHGGRWVAVLTPSGPARTGS